MKCQGRILANSQWFLCFTKVAKCEILIYYTAEDYSIHKSTCAGSVPLTIDVGELFLGKLETKDISSFGSKLGNIFTEIKKARGYDSKIGLLDNSKISFLNKIKQGLNLMTNERISKEFYLNP